LLAGGGAEHVPYPGSARVDFGRANVKSSTAAWMTAAWTLAWGAQAEARPRVIEESQVLEAPQAAWTYFAESVAVDGNWALATALYSADGSYQYPYRQLALLYRRTGSGWVFDLVLVDDAVDEASWNYPGVAMKNGLAAVSTSPLRAFRLTDSGWTPTAAPFPAPPSGTSWANGITRIDGGTLAAVAGKCDYGAITSEHQDGTWSAPRVLTGNARMCSLPNYSGSLDLDGNWLAFSNPQEDTYLPPTVSQVYQRAAPGAPWQLHASLPVGEYGYSLALRDDELFVGSWHPLGTQVFRRVSGQWQPAGHLPVVDGFSDYYDGATHLAKSDEFILAPSARHEDRPGGIAVYRRQASGAYEQVALLQSSRGDWLGPAMDISGRTVMVSAVGDTSDAGRLYVFELPVDLSAPAALQHDFENGADDWDVQAGQFAVTRRSTTRVFYQSSLTGLATAVLPGRAGANQSVEADVRPRGFSGADRWVGLATRRADQSNYYFVTLRSSGNVQLRIVRDGVARTLASAPLPVTVNRTYRLRLESIGSRHRVFVDDLPVLALFNSELDAGDVALLTYRASADFDNVVLTPNARTLIYDNTLDGTYCRAFRQQNGLRESGAPQWDCEDYFAGYLRQASALDVARAALGPDTDDQVVESRLMPESFAAAGTQDKWIGLMTRYRDERNYYYLTLRSSGAVSLRKLVDGQISELDSAALAVVPGAWRTLRLEAVGDHLRAYVDGALLLEARDATHPSGASGIVTWRTVGRFDYLRLIQP
jgi:hypothetical protein